MKSFKHKKTGDIAKFIAGNIYFIEKDQIQIHKKFVEDSCDWEEIIEKEYEILEFKDKYNKFYKLADGTFTINTTFSYAEESLLQRKYIYINRIKRVSDDEILTIGDKVKLNNGNYYGSIIKEFRFYTNGETGHLMKHRNKTFLKVGIQSFHSSEPTFFYLSDIVKLKCLFTTEEGKDIYKGDTSYGVRKTDYEIVKIKHTDTTYISNLFKEFSTLELAEEFVILNKPCFRINDIISALSLNSNPTYWTEESAVKKLKEKIKWIAK